MDRLAIIAGESGRLADVLADADPDRRCPTCPEWSAADLLWHLTEVQLFWGEILARNAVSDAEMAAAEQARPPRPTDVTGLLDLRAQATARLVEQLADHDDTQPLWSWWAPDQTVGFTRRMQTYEATMHRIDAELTANVPVTPITADVAAGALDHTVDVMWGWMPDDAEFTGTAVVEFVATDTGSRWLVEVGTWTSSGQYPNGPRATRASGETPDPSATVTAPVVDLAKWAWTRGSDVTVTGEATAIDALTAVVEQGI